MARRAFYAVIFAVVVKNTTISDSYICLWRIFRVFCTRKQKKRQKLCIRAGWKRLFISLDNRKKIKKNSK
jgi:hypothetical protein